MKILVWQFSKEMVCFDNTSCANTALPRPQRKPHRLARSNWNNWARYRSGWAQRLDSLAWAGLALNRHLCKLFNHLSRRRWSTCATSEILMSFRQKNSIINNVLKLNLLVRPQPQSSFVPDIILSKLYGIFGDTVSTPHPHPNRNLKKNKIKGNGKSRMLLSHPRPNHLPAKKILSISTHKKKLAKCTLHHWSRCLDSTKNPKKRFHTFWKT